MLGLRDQDHADAYSLSAKFCCYQFISVEILPNLLPFQPKSNFNACHRRLLPQVKLTLAAQRKIKWLGTGAEIEVPKALRSETPKASRGVGNGEGVSPSPAN